MIWNSYLTTSLTPSRMRSRLRGSSASNIFGLTATVSTNKMKRRLVHRSGRWIWFYKNAEITMIAAAGKDPRYGLPGVGRRHRASQPCAKIGEHFLVSALDDLSYCIQDSPWRSRGWTYQEGVLSRRPKI